LSEPGDVFMDGKTEGGWMDKWMNGWMDDDDPPFLLSKSHPSDRTLCTTDRQTPELVLKTLVFLPPKKP